ncbi:MAG: winged helix-turn-helix transcriptional regulator [Alistipes sp.]|nr:winged helix-turn-helix transcriptional regulator [Alistipes sp.]
MAKTTLDATDRKILRFLIKNARMPYLEIARECGISGAAIHQRIKKLEDMGVIMGSRLVVAPKSLGFDVCAFISIRVSDLTRQQDTVELLRKIPEIVECHYITGSYNLMVKLYCVDNEHLMRTIFDHILQVQGVSSTQTYISLNESFQREIHVDSLDD